MSDNENRTQDQEPEEETPTATSMSDDSSDSLTEGDPPIIIQGGGSGTST